MTGTGFLNVLEFFAVLLAGIGGVQKVVLALGRDEGERR